MQNNRNALLIVDGRHALCPDLLMRIVKHIDILALASFSNSSTYFRNIAEESYRLRFKEMASLIAPNCPDAFIHILDYTRSIISGSMALKYCINTTLWSPADIDIYTPKQQFAYVVLFFLNIGYTKGVTCTVYDENRGYTCVQKVSLGEIKIDIIQSESEAALGPLASFWSSAVTNGATPRGVFMSDPILTVYNHGLLHHGIDRGPSHIETSPRTTACIAKYAQRGFSFSRDICGLPLNDSQRWYFEKHPDLKCSHHPRSLGDKFTAVCRFNTTEVRGEEVKMSTAEWVTGGNRCICANCVVEEVLSDETIATVLQSSEDIELPLCCESFNRIIDMKNDSALRKLFKA